MGISNGSLLLKGEIPLIVMFSCESPEIIESSPMVPLIIRGTVFISHSMVTVLLFSIIKQWKVAGRVITVVRAGGPANITVITSWLRS